jgi:hypothetical protein
VKGVPCYILPKADHERRQWIRLIANRKLKLLGKPPSTVNTKLWNFKNIKISKDGLFYNVYVLALELLICTFYLM